MYNAKRLTAFAGAAAIALGSQAAPLLVDMSTGASPAQTGWETISGTGSPSGTFSGYTELASGDITVSLANISFDRLYKNGFTGPADDFPGTDLDSMYSDLLFRNNSSATVDVTISGLQAGTYTLTTHHLIATSNPGTFDIDVTDATGTVTLGPFDQGTGSTTTFDPTVVSFDVVSNGTDAIVLNYR